MKALILAAGLGTRLRPLTNERPKALVEANGVSLLERNIRFLQAQGISEIIVNVHHFGEQIMDFVHARDWGLPVRISDERGLLRDTGGGIRHAAEHLRNEADFLVYNVDVLSDLNLTPFYETHRRQGNLATLAVRHRKTQRYLLFDKDLRLISRYHPETDPCPQPGQEAAAFSGIHLISSRIFSLLPEEEVFPILPVYLQLTKTECIRGYFHDESFWMDMGRPESIADYTRRFSGTKTEKRSGASDF
ncbi:MAG: nucleotidyltransferase family protein [Bacteroidales bacterium]|nr:nucleotidyltransferase family protein [Bacteroidales bacterium]